MKSNRTHTPPPIIEELGDETYYYNFEVITSQSEDGADVFDYKQVRCSLPVDAAEIQEELIRNKSDHIVQL